MTWLTNALMVIWGKRPDTKAEAKLLFKIDWFVLSFTCLNYWSNYLNRSNLANAYVSGMKEDLHFQGNQYNDAITIFTIGYIIGLVPNNLMLQVVPPRIWLPFTALLWGVLSACISKIHTVPQLFAIRFLQALAESSTFSGSHYILGSWYKDDELGKRSGIFASSAQMGSLFSGIMQASIHQTLNGARGLAGWRWLFIFDGVIAIFIAIYGFIFFPDTPAKTRAAYFSEEERRLAVERLPPRPQTTMSWSLIRRTLKSWQWYGFSALFAVSSMLEAIGFIGIFQLWLSAEKYPVAKVNYYADGLVAVAIFVTLVCATLTDYTQKRWTVNIFMAVAMLFSSITLLVYDGVPRWLKFAAYCVAGSGYAGQATNFAWANQSCSDDDQVRAVVLASMNVWSNVLAAWWSNAWYPVTDAPRWRKGMIVLIVMSVLTVLVSQTVLYFDRRHQRTKAAFSTKVERRTNGTGEETEDGVEGGGGIDRGLVRGEDNETPALEGKEKSPIGEA